MEFSCVDIDVARIFISSPAQELYAEDPRVWNAIFENIVQDFKECQRDGIPVSSNDRIYPIILGNKGDWSYLET